MRALLHRAMAMAVVLVAATVPALSQGVGSVSGRVTDEQGGPLSGVTITLMSPGVLGTMQATTGEEGRFLIPGVPGIHPLSIRAATPGRVAVEYVGHTARRDGVLQVNFVLRPPGEHDILVLVEGGVPYHEIALEGARSTMPGRVSTMVILDDSATTTRLLRVALERRPNAVLAIGEGAARMARRHIKDTPIVYAMVPDPEDAGLVSANMCGVPLNGGFASQLAHLRHVAPDARRIGTIHRAGRMDDCLRDLRRAADEAGLELTAADVHPGDTKGLERALAALEAEPLDAFLVLMEPGLLDADGFEHLAAFAERRRVVLGVPDPALVTDESTFAFAPGFREMGAFAGTLVRRILEGRAEPSDIGTVFPDRATLAAARVERQDPRELLAGGDAPVERALHKP
jgi:ABC-type uncharacterized transport system substrate-binding protein